MYGYIQYLQSVMPNCRVEELISYLDSAAFLNKIQSNNSRLYFFEMFILTPNYQVLFESNGVKVAFLTPSALATRENKRRAGDALKEFLGDRELFSQTSTKEQRVTRSCAPTLPIPRPPKRVERDELVLDEMTIDLITQARMCIKTDTTACETVSCLLSPPLCHVSAVSSLLLCLISSVSSLLLCLISSPLSHLISSVSSLLLCLISSFLSPHFSV